MTQRCRTRHPSILAGKPQRWAHLLPSCLLCVCGSQVSAPGSGAKGSGGEARNLTVLSSNPALACAYCVTSDKSLYLSEPVSSLGSYLRCCGEYSRRYMGRGKHSKYQTHNKYLGINVAVGASFPQDLSCTWAQRGCGSGSCQAG